eukprot:Nk52_evm1s2618 gene=Nk52_evmTU1s2618
MGAYTQSPKNGGFGILKVETQVRRLKHKLLKLLHGGREQIWKLTLRKQLKELERYKARIWNLDRSMKELRTGQIKFLDCAREALIYREVESKPIDVCKREEILRTPVWKWVVHTLIPRDLPFATREDKIAKAKLLVKVRKWHRVWEVSDLDTVGDWFNEDLGVQRFFSEEEMSHYIERRGRTRFTEEEKQWTRRVIGTLKGKLDRALQNKSRASVKEGNGFSSMRMTMFVTDIVL